MRAIIRGVLIRKYMLTLVRYGLSVLMMDFGVLKIIGMQFHAIHPLSVWQQPLSQLTGSQLAWAFLGYSKWFEVLLGIFEFVPACMLLFRRTAVMGAVFLLPMTFGVLLTNYALDMWQNTKQLSVMLVCMNLILVAADLQKIMVALRALWSTPYNKHLPELIAAFILIAIPVARRTTSSYAKNDSNILTGDWYNRNQYEYTLLTNSGNSHKSLKCFFGPRGEYSEINDSINNLNGYISYYVDTQKKLLTIVPDGYIIQHHTYYRLMGQYKYDINNDSLTLYSNAGNNPCDTLTFSRHVALTRQR